MRIQTSVPFVLLCAMCTHAAGPARNSSAQQQPAQTSSTRQQPSSATAATPKADTVKRADIQHLMDVMGAKDMLTDVMSQMGANMKPVLMQSLPPGEYRQTLIDLFLQRFQSKISVKKLLDTTADAYDKYFADQDIKDMAQFYQTPLGKKMLSVLPKMTVEVQTENMKLGEDLGRQSMEEILAEHPELSKAMQEAAQNAASK